MSLIRDIKILDSQMMDVKLEKGDVMSHAKQNIYSTQLERCDKQTIVSHGKDVLRNRFITSSHGTPDDTEEPLKEVVKTNQLNDILSEEIVDTSLWQGDSSDEKYNKQHNKIQSKRSRQARKSGESEQKDKTTTLNGCIKMEQNSLNVIVRSLNKKKAKEARYSGKSFTEEADSLSHISESLSTELELNTNGIGADSGSRKDDDCSPSIRRKNTALPKGSSEFNSLSRVSGSEKEQSKKKISFRALVRMKGLGRKLRMKHQGKSKQKQNNNKTESNNKSLFFSDSSAKYLLESSTSATDEQSVVYKRTVRNEETTSLCEDKPTSYSCSGTTTTECIFQNVDSSSENHLCSSEYLEKRRFAMCEELEKKIVCGEQTLAELRSILVIQHKLTGFGLL